MWVAVDFFQSPPLARFIRSVSLYQGQFASGLVRGSQNFLAVGGHYSTKGVGIRHEFELLVRLTSEGVLLERSAVQFRFASYFHVLGRKFIDDVKIAAGIVIFYVPKIPFAGIPWIGRIVSSLNDGHRVVPAVLAYSDDPFGSG